jgi:hypothetical protein
MPELGALRAYASACTILRAHKRMRVALARRAACMSVGKRERAVPSAASSAPSRRSSRERMAHRTAQHAVPAPARRPGRLLK